MSRFQNLLHARGDPVDGLRRMSEGKRDTILIPIPVLKYFTSVERIDPLYVQVLSAGAGST